MKRNDFLQNLKDRDVTILSFNNVDFYKTCRDHESNVDGRLEFNITAPDIPKTINVYMPENEDDIIFSINLVPLQIEFDDDDALRELRREVMLGKRIIEFDDNIKTKSDWFNKEVKKLEKELFESDSYLTNVIFWDTDGNVVASLNISFLYQSKCVLLPSVRILTEHNGHKEAICLFSDDGVLFIKKNITDNYDKLIQTVSMAIEKYLYSFS
jgi:hypothetical protein